MIGIKIETWEGSQLSSSQLKRFGVSMSEELLKEFDAYIEEKGFDNRSDAVRKLVRSTLANHSWTKDDQIVAGSILLFYDHHERNLVNELLDIQHNYHNEILATNHFHINHDSCLEVIIVKGKASALRQLNNALSSLKGVKYSKLSVSP